jgi:hypothetical protein
MLNFRSVWLNYEAPDLGEGGLVERATNTYEINARHSDTSVQQIYIVHIEYEAD